jgi:hypothetical protein
VQTVDIELVQHAKPKGHKLRGTATLGYSRRESALSSCCICAILGQGVQLPNTDVKGVESPMHHILGYFAALYWLGPSGTIKTTYDLVKSMLWIRVRESDTIKVHHESLLRDHTLHLTAIHLTL